MVARLSSLIFLGEKICHDPAWINVSVNYTRDAFAGMRALRMWPSVLHPIVHWFLAPAKKLRTHVRIARQIVRREMHEREMVRTGKLPQTERNPDSLDWIREVAAGRPFDPTNAQIGLSLAAIHTTSNLLTNVVYDLAAYPEYIQPLREEIRSVMQEDGVLKKTSLTKMKLMDSVLKESQRLNPPSMSMSPSLYDDCG